MVRRSRHSMSIWFGLLPVLLVSFGVLAWALWIPLVEPLVFYPDIVTGYPLWELRDAGRFEGDALRDMALYYGFPAIYRALLWPLVMVMGAPRALEAFGLLCSLVMVGFLYAMPRRPAAQMGAAMAGLALALSLDSMHGGYPRATGLLLSTVFLWALVREHWKVAASVPLLAVFAYPMVLPPAGATLGLLAAWNWKVGKWSGRRVGAVLGSLALAVGVGAWRSAKLTAAMGSACAPSQCPESPEFMEAANYTFSSVRGGAVADVLNLAEHTPGHAPVLLVLAVGALIGLGVARKDLVAAGWLLLGGLGGYLSIRLLLAIHPMPTGFASRSFVFTVPLALALGFGEGLGRVIERIRNVRWRVLVAGAGTAGPVCVALSGFDVGEVYDDHRDRAPLFAAVQALPEDAMIGGHPLVLDALPLVTARRVEVVAEAFNPWMQDWWADHKARTRAALEGAYASSEAQVRAHCADAGLTHIVVDAHTFVPEGALMPQKFDWEPLASEVRALVGRGNHYLAPRVGHGELCLLRCTDLDGPCFSRVPRGS